MEYIKNDKKDKKIVKGRITEKRKIKRIYIYKKTKKIQRKFIKK